MLISDFKHDFFRPLGGKNAPLFEYCIIEMYSAVYSTDYTNDFLMIRKELRDIFKNALEVIPWVNEDEDSQTKDNQVRANEIIRRLEGCGWIEEIPELGSMVQTIRFTKHGRRIAQTLHSIYEDRQTSRQKNVRMTFNSLKAYYDNGDPQNLLDTLEHSRYIISDLVDHVSDLHDEKKEMMRLAVKDIREAGEMFFSFMGEEFKAKIAARFAEDSAYRHQGEVERLCIEILDSRRYEEFESQLKAYYPEFRDKDYPLEDILNTVRDRMKNACDGKIPELRRALGAFVERGNMILRQAGSAVTSNNKNIIELVNLIKSSDDEEKSNLLSQVSFALSPIQSRLFDPTKLTFSKKNERKKTVCVLENDTPLSPEQIKKLLIKEMLAKELGFNEKEIVAFVETVFQEQHTISNVYLPVNDPKSLLMTLSILTILNMRSPDGVRYRAKPTGEIKETRFFTTEEYILQKGGNL